MSAFSAKQFLPDSVIARITDTRIADPDFPLRVATARQRRDRLTYDGRLNIIAADHPARLITKVGPEPFAMADRAGYLSRILRTLMADRVDGVMATMDILEDLLSIDGFIRDAGGPPLLDHKLLIVSLNRGGLHQSAWELDDPITGARPETCAAWQLDGVKILLRIAEHDKDCLKTMTATAQAITEANASGLPTFLEPLPVTGGQGNWKVAKTSAALARVAGVASALGDSSRHLWLKLPHCEDFAAVARATTLPILLLGGESAGDVSGFVHEVASAMAAGHNVRGALAGRNVLYPGPEDPLAVAEAIGGVVHEHWSVDQALESCQINNERDIDAISTHLGLHLEEVQL